ncbi:D-alanyl-D-alanine carboxypeptidase/D-alanyl-D-alanine-endopeptidase [Bifidobacterium sp. ESL0769]|uniref:D-alanyl-D-alanine carboxypeptidase/D-alanyl-D-alanine endopeptidase n=1 Tax=Bifidobacterium sp. ESL0769 TaxID=2983229 RepID=UPI0023F7757D|nr:D-alanyl-D-alanine carboxypeptidase/D-alanyl-D-alanine-endopeptidase [Bifidobacterium sp. ESL0769]WEV67920.1 D-alanyl-D-alanine carboxypeptidase/D-alanyl-D-alanine-endopeptidase [Bifidobacterium sp. ESL0769]
MNTTGSSHSGHGAHARKTVNVARSRAWRIVVSIVITLLLAAGYFVADINGVMPGPLTILPAGKTASVLSGSVRSAKSITGSADLNKPIDKNATEAVINTFAATPGLGSDFSLAIADADGKIVDSRAADTPREPASTMKTLTALASSSMLDMGSSFHTDALLDDGVGVAGGDVSESQTQPAGLTLKSDGDMLLGAGQSDPNHINGRAGLATLADETATALKKRNITQVRLKYDDTLFGSVRSPAAIASNNPGNTNFTGISSMAVDGGRQWGGADHDPDLYTEYPELSTTPAHDAAATFGSLLSQRGISVDGDIASDKPAKNAERVATVTSATLSEIMAFTLRHSDNTLIEEFGRLLALKTGAADSPEGATQAVKSRLDKLGIDTTNLHMADCSGLSEGSTLEVKTLVEVQSHNLKTGPGAAAAEGLSIPGLVGTARNRLEDPSAAGLLRVKSGSLDQVTSMAGNVSRKNGGVLAFAVVVNNPQDYGAAKSAVDTFISALAGL